MTRAVPRNRLGSETPRVSGAPGTLCAMDMDLAQRMLDVVAQIPVGRVATYGDVAARAGSVSPRLAGFVLSQLADDATPWHRVVRANGTPAAHLAAEQISRLRAENVEVIDGRVDLKTFRWRD
jgi:methylated-DNA-protein-cysteine methyltransferase-like protein